MIEYQIRPRLKKKEPLTIVTEKTIRSLIITLTALITILYVAFIMVTASSAQKGYQLDQMENRNAELRSQNMTLTAKVTSAAAAGEIESNQLVDNMAEPEQRTFVKKEDNQVN